jgi:hypothetical protein
MSMPGQMSPSALLGTTAVARGRANAVLVVAKRHWALLVLLARDAAAKVSVAGMATAGTCTRSVQAGDNLDDRDIGWTVGGEVAEA